MKEFQFKICIKYKIQNKKINSYNYTWISVQLFRISIKK